MYILMISRGIPTQNDPQWGCFEKDQAEALASIGHRVVVMSVDSRFIRRRRKIGYTEVSNNKVHYINLYLFPTAILGCLGERIGTWLRFVLRSRQFTLLMKRVISKFGLPDIIYSHFYHNTAHAVKIKEKYNIPVVGIEHAALLNDDVIPYAMKYRGNIAYESADAIISVSQTLRKRIKYHFNRDSFVVYNAVGNEFKYYSDKSSNKPFTFISVGTLEFRKGFDLLITAFSLLDLHKDSWKMIIVGSGEELSSLQNQISKAGLDDNVILLGRKSKAEIVQLLNDSHVFILPSRNENFSVAVLEALACGLPVISSICGGIRECIDDTNGLLFPVDDVSALSDCIRTIYDNYSSYNRRQISQNCMKRFSASVIAKQLTKVFESVVNK